MREICTRKVDGKGSGKYVIYRLRAASGYSVIGMVLKYDERFWCSYDVKGMLVKYSCTMRKSINDLIAKDDLRQ